LTSGSGSRTTTTSGRDDQDDKDEGRVSVPGEMCQARRLELHNQAGSGKSMAGGKLSSPLFRTLNFACPLSPRFLTPQLQNYFKVQFKVRMGFGLRYQKR